MKLTKPQLAAIADIQEGLPAGCSFTICAATTLTVVEDDDDDDDDADAEPEEPEETSAEKKKRLAKEKREAAKAKKAADDKGDGEVTLKELRALARPIVKAGRGAEVAEILEEFKAESLTKLDEDDYEEVKERLTELDD